LRIIRRIVRFLAVPTVFSALTGYFIWHAIHGERGLIARERRLAEIAAARQVLAAAEAERDLLERRVMGLRGDRLDRDQLEERARALLNMVGPEELVVPYGEGRRLY